ncbi:type I restriction endonuclease subunit R [Methanosarcinales archaeon]|nr:MAG: type I restriction endonuclease subunit R [Methanosarcinales archaeon]
MSLLGGERGAVQNPLLKYATEVGWEYISPDEALRLRGGRTGFVLRELFIDQMQRLNQDFMDHLLAEELIKRLERIRPNIEGNEVALEYIKGLRTVFVPNEKRERNVRFVDTEEFERNRFHVTDEFSFTNGSKTIRPDLVLLINGVPLFLIETKASHKIERIAEAMDQIRRYHRECPELLAILQVYALTHIIGYYYSGTWNISDKSLFNWKEEAEGDFETLVKSFFDKNRIVKVLTDFILFTRQDDELKKVILRPHQMRAVERVIARAESEEKVRGLIWHTQGSGKTYTMITAAEKIIENPIFENPTVIMLVDRNELEQQLFGNLAAVGIKQVEVAKSKRHLKKLLAADQRGLIVSMIHKFDETPANINRRENIFVLVDEAHRTTGGDLGNYLTGALPNATYIGFTGTPIDRTAYGKGTFIVFGKDDPPHGYLDKYGIAESIEDGTTVPLHYTLAPNELQVDKETLERDFLNLREAQGMNDPLKLEKVLEKAVNLRNMLKNKERVEKVARYVADHYKDYIEPMEYKAFLVGVDREACALYKEELDKYLPENYSRVVYSAGYNDSEELKKYHLSDTEEKQIRKDFRDPEKLPKILIVTEKLLTGFDAPILYCMYLDKPMRDHVLLQAIARVNRPHEDETGRKKSSGFVLDFVGIFDNLEKALAFDSQDIAGVVHDIKVLKDLFSELVEDARKTYLTIIKDKSQDKAVEAVLEYFRDEELRHEYYRFFKEVSEIYEILSPDAFLRPYLAEVEKLARMYRILREAYDPGIMVSKEFSRKTAKLVQEHTKSGEIRSTLDIYEIDEATIRKIEESNASDTEKIFNLLRSIEKFIKENAHRLPYLISIGEKAELIAELYKNRQKTTEETLEDLKNIIDEINASRKEQAERKMSVDLFSVFWILKSEGLDEPEDIANQMSEVFEKYPHWKTSENHERKIKQELYKNLLQSSNDISRTKDMVQRIMRVLVGGGE